jgi:hypothetical protein
MSYIEDARLMRAQDRFAMQIDERRKWNEWEQNKERAAEPSSVESPEDEVEREQR